MALILRIDRDLVTAAADGAPQSVPRSSARDIDRWLATVDPAERLRMLARLACGNGGVGAELVRGFRQHTQGRAAALPLHTVGELRA